MFSSITVRLAQAGFNNTLNLIFYTRNMFRTPTLLHLIPAAVLFIIIM